MVCGMSVSEKAEEIARGLSDFYKRTVFRVSRRLTEEMQTDPTDAMFALVEEIKDRLARDMPDIKTR